MFHQISFIGIFHIFFIRDHRSSNFCFLFSYTPVGTRVRSWVSGVINDMRQKNPALNKWVDATPFAKSNLTPERDYVTVSDGLNSAPIPCVNRNNETVSIAQEKNLSISDLTEFVLKNRCRSSQELYKNVPPIIITKSETNLASTSIGRLKIEEVYQKLNANKSRYDLLKKRQTEIKNILKRDVPNEPKARPVTVKAIKKITIRMDSQQELDNFEFSFDEAFSNKNNDNDDDYHRNALYSTSDDDDLLYNTKLGRSSTIKTDSRCKFTLTDIGRRFSEIVDDDTPAFVPNESNNSCPISSSMLNNVNHHQRRDSDKLLLEAAEAPLRAQSVPASPIPKQLHKKYLKRDTSLSESPRTNHQLLRDSSFQSDSSHRSSVESLLEARKPDPEIILANLGFGPAQSEDVLAKIPRRYLSI
jgi:hypothetical protein